LTLLARVLAAMVGAAAASKGLFLSLSHPTHDPHSPPSLSPTPTSPNPPPVISTAEIVSSLRAKLPEDELRATLEHVMTEAGGGGGDKGLDFDSFLHMLKVRARCCERGGGLPACEACWRDLC